MRRLDRLVLRIREELARTPDALIQDLARKFSVPEGAILEAMRDGAVRKVRRERLEAFVKELFSWSETRVRLRNDWAECEVICDLRTPFANPREIVAQAGAWRLRLSLNAIESAYFVEERAERSVRFYSRRERFIFEVTPLLADVFKRARELYCA